MALSKMDGDVLTNEANKLKALAITRGLIIPNYDQIDFDLNLEDYNLALIRIANEFEGIYAILQDIRSRTFKYEFSTNWNPFIFEHSHGCKPFFVDEIDNYGYDTITGNCRCPGVYLPCSLKQSLSDVSIWSNNIIAQYPNKVSNTILENLKISLEGLKNIDIYGTLLETPSQLLSDFDKDQHCKSSDIILCSVQGFGSPSTEWSDWSGCSAKCGTGTQERMKITYDGEHYQLVKEYRDCEISKCRRSTDIQDDLTCSLRKIPANTQIKLVNQCKCPNDDEKLCTSEEAHRTMDDWIGAFRRYCDNELYGNEKTNIIQQELWDNKKDILGRTIRIEFSDGFWFDCSENWGQTPVDDLHMYCRTGTPILCRTNTNISDTKCL